MKAEKLHYSGLAVDFLLAWQHHQYDFLAVDLPNASYWDQTKANRPFLEVLSAERSWAAPELAY